MTSFETGPEMEKDARKQWDVLPSEVKDAVNMALNMKGMPYDYPEQLENLREDYDGDGPDITPEQEAILAEKLRELASVDSSEMEKWAKENIVPLLEVQ